MKERTIKTQRLLIRPVAAEDWKSIQNIWEDANASPYARFDRPHSTDPSDVKPRIARWAEANQGTEHLFFAVCLGGNVDRLHCAEHPGSRL